MKRMTWSAAKVPLAAFRRTGLGPGVKMDSQSSAKKAFAIFAVGSEGLQRVVFFCISAWFRSSLFRLRSLWSEMLSRRALGCYCG